jgi:Zn ribbon nucleic-acid-binding protein
VIIGVGFDITDQVLIRCFAFIRYWEKNGIGMRQCISFSYTSRRKVENIEQYSHRGNL